MVQPADRTAEDPGRDRSLVEAARSNAEALRGSGVFAHVELAPLPTIPGYRIESEIHRGAQGVVYRAVRQSDDCVVAIKVLRRRGTPAGEDARFAREIEILRRIDHPGIVALYDAGSTGDGWYLVIEFIDGLPLDAHVEQAGLAREQRLELFARIAEAVHAAHLHGVIHRDLKPSNIRVRPDGHAVVLDFGLAKDPGAGGGSTLTHTGQFVGSLPWASPEQASAGGPLADVRSDVYSLGVLLYQLIADDFPYPVLGPVAEVLDAIRHAEPHSLAQLDPPVDESLETVVRTALHKDPGRRYQSAAELAREVRRCLAGEPIEARRENALASLHRRLQRHRLATASGAVLVLILGISTVVITGLYRDQQALRRVAQRDADDARSIQSFLESILTSIEPGPERGESLTVSELVRDATLRLSEAGLRPEVEASLRTTLGESLLWTGRAAQARAEFERALELASTDGPEGPEGTRTAHRLHQLGLAHQQLGDYVAAERHFQQALDAYAATPDAPVQETVHCLRSFALFELARDRLKSSGRLLARAEQLATDLPGQPEIALRLLLDRGQLAMRSGDLVASEVAFRAAYEAAQARTEASPGILHSAANHLGTVLIELSRFEEAATYLEKALAGREVAFGAHHEHTLQTRHALSILRARTGRLAEAETLARATIAGYTAINGAEHPRTLHVRMNHARIREAHGDTAGAEADFTECLRGLRAALGEDALEVAICASELGALLLRAHRPAEAAPLLQDAYQGFTAREGGTHAYRMRAGNDLTFALRKLGRHAECVSLLSDLHAAHCAVAGEGTPEAIGIVQNLAAVQQDMGDNAGARHTLGGAIQALRTHPPARPIELAHALGRLAILDRQAQDLDAAEQHLQEARTILETMPPEEVGTLLDQVLTNLADLHEARGDAGRAAETPRPN